MRVAESARSSFRARAATSFARTNSCAIGKREGVVLISVVVVIFILTLAATHYLEMMVSEYKATENSMRLIQARAFANSGVHYVAAVLSNPDNVNSILGGNPFAADAFSDIELSTGYASSTIKGKFRVMAPSQESGQAGFGRGGVQDESGKINVNGIMKIDPSGKTLREMLVKLGASEEVADAIVDWLDADDTPRDLGAESDYYGGLSPAYSAKNNAIDSLEELLLVKGVTESLLYGTDYNRNGVLDEGEDAGEGFDLGLSGWLTVYGRETLTDMTLGTPLLDINSDDLQTLYDTLSPDTGEDLAKFILIYRLFGTGSGTSGSSGSGSTRTSALRTTTRPAAQKSGSSGSGSTQTVDGSLSDLDISTLDLTQKAAKKISAFSELINAEVTIASKDQKSPSVRYKSPLGNIDAQKELLPILFEKATTQSGKTDVFGLININTASYEVLTALPGLQEGDADKIYAVQPKLLSGEPLGDAYKTPAWLLTEAGLSRQRLQGLEKYVTTRTQVYRVQVIGYFENTADGTRSPSARVEAVIDTNNGRPRLLYWRDLTELGTGAEMQD